MPRQFFLKGVTMRERVFGLAVLGRGTASFTQISISVSACSEYTRLASGVTSSVSPALLLTAVACREPWAG